MPNRLFVDALRSIGLVKAGDNPDAEVVIWKSKDEIDEMLPEGWMMSKVLPSVENASVEGEQMDLSAITDEPLRKSIEDSLAEKDTQISDLTKKVEELTPEPPVEELAKDAPAEVQALLKAQADELVKVRADLDSERKARLEAEYVEKAKPFAALLGNPSEVGPLLADIAEKAPDSWSKVHGMLTAASQRQGLAELFKERGSGEGSESDDPLETRDAYVQKMLADGSDKSAETLRGEFWQTSQGREMKKELRS